MHRFWAAKAAGVIGLSKMDISGLSPDGLQANRNRYNTSVHVRMEEVHPWIAASSARKSSKLSSSHAAVINAVPLPPCFVNRSRAFSNSSRAAGVLSLVGRF